MAKNKRYYQNGYCDQCLYNIEHVRSVKDPIARALDGATWKITRFLGIGPWYCISCGSRKLLVPTYRRNVKNYDPRVAEPPKPKPDEFDRVGNFIQTDLSLKVRADRKGRYSEKFRDSVVEKLLGGKTKFSEIRNEIDVSEQDLQSWIARYHEKRIERIKVEFARLHAELGGNEFQILNEFEDREISFDDLDTIDAVTLNENDAR